MAKSLNKARMRNSRRAVWAVTLLYLVSAPWIQEDTLLDDACEIGGYILALICALGRIYCTLFLGGRKNAQLVTEGPFSVVRNPLYVFSLIGIVGIGLMSTRITILIALLAMHIISYHFLVRREEARLLETFGDAYRDYCARVPRFLPKLKNYHMPEVIEARPSLLLIAIRDAWLWILPYPVFEIIDQLHEAHILPVFFTMY